MNSFTPSELLKLRLRDKPAFARLPQVVNISVGRLSSDAYGDLADLVLALSGRSGVWVDGRGETRPNNGLVKAAGGLTRDAFALPFLYARHKWLAQRLARRGGETKCA